MFLFLFVCLFVCLNVKIEFNDGAGLCVEARAPPPSADAVCCSSAPVGG